MGEVINLRRVRKARDRAAADVEAARNRASFGRTRAERAASADETGRREATLDAHRLDPSRGRPDGGPID